MRLQRLLLALALTPCLCARAEVLITEVMYNPQGTDRESGGFNKEWVEIFNAGDQVVNLSGWSLGDSQDGDFSSPLPARTLLYPQEAMVITGDAQTFDAQWGAGVKRIEVGGFPVLANTPSPANETIVIRDSLGGVVDAVNLSASNGWPKIDGSDGHSVMALPQGLTAAGNDLGGSWAPSVYGVYGGEFANGGGLGENHGSPGIVHTQQQSPFEPSPDAAWSMVVIPDTQNYVKSSAYRGIFTQMTEWVRDHRDQYNIQLVLHEGDIVNNNDTLNPTSGDQVSAQQWSNAKTSLSVLDGHVPYVLAAGNHDFGTTNAQNRSTELNNYFSTSDNPLNDPAQGGILAGLKDPGRLENAYYDFVAPDGRKMLILALEWEPRPETVEWANGVVSDPRYSDHTAVLLTHAYVNGGESRYSGSKVSEDADGEELWQDLVGINGNFELAFNGHFGGDGAGYVGSRGAGGGVVHQMFFNTQFQSNGGAGWLRMVEFLEDGRTVRVRTYSPYLDLYRTDPANAFEIALSQNLAGDFNGDLVVDAADYVVWRDSLADGSLVADANGDQVVDEHDYAIWRLNYGRGSAAAGADSFAPVPDPASVALMAALLLHVLQRNPRTSI